MSSVLLWWPWWPWGLAAVVSLFWAVGAYSRLLRLRAAIGQAFAALAPAWQRRLTWVRARSLQPGSETAQRLTAACGQCALALEQARKKPFDAALIRSLALAGNVLDTVWTAVDGVALPQAEAQSDDGGLTWDALQHQALPLQVAFNAQVARYNHAVTQFPASVLALVLRFKRAAALPVAEGVV